MDADPAANIVVTGTASLAQLKSIDVLNGAGTISVVINDTAANLLDTLTNEVPGVYKPYIEQATNFRTTNYSGQNLLL